MATAPNEIKSRTKGWQRYGFFVGVGLALEAAAAFAAARVNAPVTI